MFISDNGRYNIAYSIKNNAYRKLAALAGNHGTIEASCVNFKDEAIFTFFVDKSIKISNRETGIKVGVMDLVSIDND